MSMVNVKLFNSNELELDTNTGNNSCCLIAGFKLASTNICIIFSNRL